MDRIGRERREAAARWTAQRGAEPLEVRAEHHVRARDEHPPHEHTLGNARDELVEVEVAGDWGLELEVELHRAHF